MQDMIKWLRRSSVCFQNMIGPSLTQLIFATYALLLKVTYLFTELLAFFEFPRLASSLVLLFDRVNEAESFRILCRIHCHTFLVTVCTYCTVPVLDVMDFVTLAGVDLLATHSSLTKRWWALLLLSSQLHPFIYRSPVTKRTNHGPSNSRSQQCGRRPFR